MTRGIIALAGLVLTACSPEPDPPTPGGPPQCDMSTPVDMRAEGMTIAPDLGIDMRQPNMTTPPEDMNTPVDMPAEDMSVDMGCVPMCSGRVCGDDGCGGSCGDCGALEVCGDAGACEEAPNQLTITLNNEVVYQTTDVELQYVEEQDALLASWPRFGDHPFSLSASNASGNSEQTLSCATPPEDLTMGMTVSTRAIESLPPSWKELTFVYSTQCGLNASEYTASFTISPSEVSPDFVKAAFVMSAEGGGSRSGDVLRVSGRIEAAPL